MTRSLPPLLALGLTACAHHATLRSEFDARLSDALTEPAPPSPGWAEDAVAWFDDDVVDALVSAAVRDLTLERTFDLLGARATPRLRVTDVHLAAPTAPCESCLGVTMVLDGTVALSALGVATEPTLRVTVSLDAGLDVASAGGTFSVSARVLRVGDVRVAWQRAPDWAVSVLPASALTGWVSQQVLASVPPLPVASFGGDAVPVSGLRVAVRDGGFVVEAHTRAPVTLAVGELKAVKDDWAVRIPSETVLQLARKTLFAAGPIDHDVWVDPRALSLGDGTFRLTFRLWRVRGLPWWREIVVEGGLSIHRTRLELHADSAREVGHSSGAGVSDPLVALARAQVLDAIARAVTTSVPTKQAQAVGAQAVEWRIRELWSDGADLVITGDATVGAAP